MAQTGITAKTVKRIVLDAGAMYRNHGTPQASVIGATRGGATFTIEREDREIEVDGTKGPIMGMLRTIRHTARLEATFVEMSKTTLIEMLRGTASIADPAGGAATTHDRIVPDNVIATTDYLDNVSLVADVMNVGDPVIIRLLNVLLQGDLAITTDDDDEGTVGITYVATYDPALMDTPPYEIYWPVAAEV